MSARHRRMRKLVRVVERGVFGNPRYWHERGWDAGATVEGGRFWWEVADRLDSIRLQIKPPANPPP
jgi:hypothetical protein